jgi:hypothetical protein
VFDGSIATGYLVKHLNREHLENLPGVGPAIAGDLRRLGVDSPRQLEGEDPEQLFERLIALDGPTDRCVLYTFRAAHYYATTPDAEVDPPLLLWWNWKD